MTGYHERLTQLARWRGRRLQAFGVELVYRDPEVGELLVCGATATHPGVPRRVASVRATSREGRLGWIIEHTALDEEPTTSARSAVGYWQQGGWPRLPEHYPVCGKCGDLMPCKHAVIDQIAAQSAEDFDRYGDPSVCPSCREPISDRQKSVVFDRNLHGWGSVAFHTRRKCFVDAVRYDQSVHREDQNYQLSCPGQLIRSQFVDSTVFYCTQQQCRDPHAPHVGGVRWQNTAGGCPDGFFPTPP